MFQPAGQRWHGIGVADDIENDKEAPDLVGSFNFFFFSRRYSARSNLRRDFMSVI